MSMPPKVSWPERGSRILSASMIRPAQVPYTGMPAAMRARRGPAMPKRSASLEMVVDSPPGMTRPSTWASSSGRRTGLATASAAARAIRCSRTSPWRARTPITGVVLIGAYQPRFA